MADEILWIDHASDGTGSPLQIGMGTAYELLSQSYPAPEQQVMYASNVDTEGELDVSRRYTNREIRLELEFADPTGVLLAALQGKYGKLQAEGGTLRRTYKDGTTIRVYDAITANGWDPGFDLTYYLGDVVKVSITLPAKPLARGAAVTQPDRVETTLPCLIATETGITGDVAASGQLTIDNDAGAGNDWWGVEFGMETDALYTFTDSSGSASLFYQAESRTAMGGAATAVGPAGASGAGSNVMRHTTLPTSFVAVLSTQASGGGAHLTHVGSFNVRARVQVPTSNTGTVSVALEWGVGDFRRFTQGPTRTLDPSWEGTWRRVDLGQVTIPKVLTGTQRWEGRVLAKSTVLGDDIDIDWIEFIPAGECSGRAEAVLRAPSPTAFVARDEFDQTAGALNAKVAPVGGTWATSGGATDFQVTGSGAVTRNVGSEVEWAGRFAIVGATNYTDVAAHVEIDGPRGVGNSGWHGLVLRYVDANNWLAIVHNPGGNNPLLTCVSNVAGTKTTLGSWGGSLASLYPVSIDATVSSIGGFTGRLTEADGYSVASVSGAAAALAIGGTLATGKIGFYSERRSAAATYTFDNFRASSPPPDAAVFAGQSIQVRHDGVIREDSAGSFWQPPSSYIGDYLRVPVAGAEARSTRFVVAPLYAPETNGARIDHRTDDLSARLTYEPRYLT